MKGRPLSAGSYLFKHLIVKIRVDPECTPDPLHPRIEQRHCVDVSHTVKGNLLFFSATSSSLEIEKQRFIDPLNL